MAGPENTGLASERNPNCAVVVGKQPAARVNLRIHPRSTRRCWAGCRWPVGWRNKCCSKCDRGLNRHSPSRRTNWAWATCSSTACGSPGRWPCWRMRRDCCERERCWGDHPCARCWQTCCPANCRWNWGRRTPCHSYTSQTQTHKIPNEINVSHFGFRNTLYEHPPSAGIVERLYDLRLVRPLEIWPRLATLEGDPGLVGNRAARILPGGAGQSPRLCPFLGIPTQDHSRGHHHHCLHWIRHHLSEGETCVELSRGVRLSWRGCVLRLCVQGTRACCLNGAADVREEVYYAPLVAFFTTPHPSLRICARFHRRILDRKS